MQPAEYIEADRGTSDTKDPIYEDIIGYVSKSCMYECIIICMYNAERLILPLE